MTETQNGNSIRKGTSIPVDQINKNDATGDLATSVGFTDDVNGKCRLRDGYGENNGKPCILVPSWTANGIFSTRQECDRRARKNDGIGARKRQRIHEASNDNCASSRSGSYHSTSKVHQLVSNEVRQCDVCACAVLWTPTLEGRYFSPAALDLKEDSIAESLPQFVEGHVTCASPLPCSFCSANQAFRQKRDDLSFPWCGTLFCSRDCQIQGENASNIAKSDTTMTTEASTTTINDLGSNNPCASIPILPPTKLFFCRNRVVQQPKSIFVDDDGVEQQMHKQAQTCGENIELLDEIAQSLVTMEARLRIICGCHDGNAKDSLQITGFEECALLLTTIISCTCPLWIGECLSWLSKKNIVHINVQEDGCDEMANREKSETIKVKKQNIKNEDIESEEESLVEELWAMSRSYWSLLTPLHQSSESLNYRTEIKFPPYQEFLQCYLYIKRYCLLRVSGQIHPLVSYATKTLISTCALTEKERDLALGLLRCPWVCPPLSTRKSAEHLNSCANGREEKDDIQSTVLRWRNAAHFAHWVSTSTEPEDGEQKQIQSWLGKSYFAFSPWHFRNVNHSCAPNLILSSQNKKKDKDAEIRLHGKNEQELAWLALHNIQFGEELTVSKLDTLDDDAKTRAKGLRLLMGKCFDCGCLRCKYEQEEHQDKSPTILNQYGLKRLADLAMQHGRFNDAAKLYNSIIEIDPQNGDTLHAKAASFLGRASSSSFVQLGHCQGYFVQAQRLWAKAASIKECAGHPDIALQAEKQLAYGINALLKQNVGSSSACTADEDVTNTLSGCDAFKFSSYLNEKCFITNSETPILSFDECNFVIASAEKHAKDNSSGWTTSRHYAVPTTDIPVHEIFNIRPWFNQLWKERVRPLLRQQLQLHPNDKLSTSSSLNRDIFIHDAFVVRYDTQGGQRYLPPHYDESTHSFIIALNTNHKGGGTFIHELGQTLKPTVAGGMLSFCGGELLHSGDPVVEGARYIIVAFCYVDLVESPDSSVENVINTQTQSTLKGLFRDNKNAAKTATSDKVVADTSQGFSFGFQF